MTHLSWDRTVDFVVERIWQTFFAPKYQTMYRIEVAQMALRIAKAGWTDSLSVDQCFPTYFKQG